MALKDYILTLSSERTTERTLMIERIARECGVHTSTIYKWMNGKTIPDLLKQKKVAEITGVSANELFKKENECATT